MTPSASPVAERVNDQATPQALRTVISGAAAAGCREGHPRHLRAVILTGSLARNEASFLREGDGWRLLGDAEFLAVWDSRADLPSHPQIAALRQEIGSSLAARGIVAEVSVAAVPTAYLRALPPHIFTYELRTCGEVVWGPSDLLSLIPAFPPSQLSRDDAWRLLCNRIIEQLEPLARVTAAGATLPPELHYRSVKLVLDMATSFLVFVGQYAPTYTGRRDRLRTLAEGNGSASGWPFPLATFARDVAACTRWKLSPAPGEPGQGWEFWRGARECARRLARWELERLVESRGSLPEAALVTLWSRRQPLHARVRGWLSALRREGWRQGVRHGPRWTRLALRGSPRSCVYAAATQLFFHAPDPTEVGPGGRDHADLSRLRGWLPLVGEGHAPGPAAGWRGLATEVTHNYRRLLVETRA